ncbi:MAG TPA: hypothetical protein VJ654_07970 [Noviherbaspirillum sp.]|nr:hypothetical protein [Noviherbaspirillum sp.]
MISNLKSARRAIEAEMSYAKQGAAYYLARVEALENALHQLESVDISSKEVIGDARAQTRTKRVSSRKMQQGSSTTAPSAQQTNKTKPAAKNTSISRSKGADNLPPTGRDFWFALVNSQPQSAVDISNAAITALGIKPDQKGQIQKIKQRVSPALANLVATQKIKDAGSGRARRFFKDESVQ